MRIVIADDSALLREGLVAILTEAGHEVVAAVADELVVAPAQAESARHARTRELLDRLAR